VKIPRIIHRIWLGGERPRDESKHYEETWRKHHPGWEIRLWTEDDLPEFGLTDALKRGRHHAERADVLRYELLNQFGGVYVDIDFECLRSLEPLLAEVEVFAALQMPERVSNAMLGAVPGHPLFERASREAALRIGVGTIPTATGPRFFTELLKDFPEVTLYGPEKFFPYLWTEEHRAHEHFPEAYAVHHWAKSANSWLLSPGGVPARLRRQAVPGATPVDRGGGG
jgi:mannosyltransferase OCH1-like enzyme